MRTLTADQSKSSQGLNFGKPQTRNVLSFNINDIINFSTFQLQSPSPAHYILPYSNKAARISLECPEGSECP